MVGSVNQSLLSCKYAFDHMNCDLFGWLIGKVVDLYNSLIHCRLRAQWMLGIPCDQLTSASWSNQSVQITIFYEICKWFNCFIFRLEWIFIQFQLSYSWTNESNLVNESKVDPWCLSPFSIFVFHHTQLAPLSWINQISSHSPKLIPLSVLNPNPCGSTSVLPSILLLRYLHLGVQSADCSKFLAPLPGIGISLRIFLELVYVYILSIVY